MKKGDLFKESLSDEFTNNYIKDFNIQTRMNITGISYWCKVLAEADDSECNYDFRVNVANNIIKYCCQILKNSELYANISDSIKEGDIRKTTVELNDYLTDFCEKCNRHIEGKCRIILSKCENSYIEINEKFFNFILLVYVRIALSKKYTKLEISFSSEQNYVTICLKATDKKSDGKYSEDVSDIFSDYFNDIIPLVLKKIGGTFSGDVECSHIKFTESKGNALCSPKPRFIGEDLMNIFSIMLADFDVDNIQKKLYNIYS